MRLLLLSDIHAHAGRLERVLAAASGAWDQAVLLGDVVGYGSDPVRTVELLLELPVRAAVEGNHEAMLWRLLEGRPVRATTSVTHALQTHAEQLSDEHLGFLRGFEPTHVDERWAAVHGSPQERFAYVLSVPDARRNEPHMPRDVVFVGHTHIPGAYVDDGSGWRVVPVRQGGRSLTLRGGDKAFVNPGSVGAARDGGAGAAYAIFDEESRAVAWHRGV